MLVPSESCQFEGEANWAKHGCNGVCIGPSSSAPFSGWRIISSAASLASVGTASPVQDLGPLSVGGAEGWSATAGTPSSASGSSLVGLRNAVPLFLEWANCASDFGAANGSLDSRYWLVDDGRRRGCWPG